MNKTDFKSNKKTKTFESLAPKAGFRIYKVIESDKNEEILISTVKNLNEAYDFINSYETWNYKTRLRYHKLMIEWDDPFEHNLKHYIDFSIDHQNEWREICPETAKIYDSNDPIFRDSWR